MKAEEAKVAAERRKAHIAKDERRELEVRWRAQSRFFKDRNFDHELAEIVSKATSKDPLWKGHVEDNKWFMQQAIMYGIAATNDGVTRLVQILAQAFPDPQPISGTPPYAPR